MDIRHAKPDDISRLLHLAQVEHARSQFREQAFDRDYVAAGMRTAMQGMLSTVLISGSGLGFIAGCVQPSLLNRHFTAYELAWYAEDGSGMALLRSFVAWARGMRAITVQVSNYAGIKDGEQFERVMRHEGFALLGPTFTKRLES